MENESLSPAASPAPENTPESTESFGELLSAFERSHKAAGESQQLEGSVISVSADRVFLDIGFKVEGVLPRSVFPDNADALQPGQRFPVSVRGRNEEGYYELSRFKVAQPTDWASLEKAFEEKSAIAGTVTAQVKGGFSVDVGVRAFMPVSRSGVREAAEMADLVGQSITCRITKLDEADENVVVDRRVVLEEEALAQQQSQFATLRPGDVLSGKVRSLTSYGAFVDLGGIDGLLHVSDISWSRVQSPEEVLSVGQELQVKVLKIDAENHKISLGLKQLQPEPWETAAEKYKAGQRVTGTVRRLMDFGAFVEVEPGIEGLIHVSEMSWVKRVRKPSDILKEGDTVDAVVLQVNPAEKRMSLGLKQALGDPWQEVPQRFPAGSSVEGPVTRLTKFGAFVQMTEGVEGLVHISEITAEKHLHHPQEALKVGELVRAKVLGIDPEKRQVRLSIKQMAPTSTEEFFAENNVGEKVSGRVVEVRGDEAVVEIGEGVRATCRIQAAAVAEEKKAEGKADLSSLTSLLQARWKGGAPAAVAQPEVLRAGQVRQFRIVNMDREQQRIELNLA